MDVIRKITLSDLVNLNRRETDVLANVEKGDLIRLCIDKKELIAIVVDVDKNSMELHTPDGEIRWVSRYVIYEKL